MTYAEHFIKNIARQWFDCSPQLRVRFQKRVFPEGIVYDLKNGFRTTKLGCIFQINNEITTQNLSGYSHIVVVSL